MLLHAGEPSGSQRNHRQSGSIRVPRSIAIEGSDALLVDRVVRMLEEDEPPFVSGDPNNIGADADETPPTVAGMLEDLTQARQATITRFSAIEPDAWQRAGTHPEFGRMTAIQQLAYLVRHEQWHLAEMEERGWDAGIGGILLRPST